MENVNIRNGESIGHIFNEQYSVELIRKVPHLMESEYFDDIKHLLITMAEYKDKANKEDRELVRKHYERYCEEYLNSVLTDIKSLVDMLNVDETNQSIVEDLKKVIEVSLL